MPSGGEILTVGHSNHEEQDFLELVRGAGVELIADVRANPRSRYPQFNRSALAGTMKAAGIGYAPLGADLGGPPRPGREHGQPGLGRSRPSAATQTTWRQSSSGPASGCSRAWRAIAVPPSCAPRRTWTRCHRRLLADALTVRDWRVLHLGPTGNLTPHELTDFAVVENGVVTYPAQQTSLGI